MHGFENLMSRISRLSQLEPLAISVTWGAGGSTKDRSLELAGLTQSNGLNTILHLTCTNMEMGLIDEVLKAVKEQGIQNILALRGGVFTRCSMSETLMPLGRCSPRRRGMDSLRPSIYSRY